MNGWMWPYGKLSTSMNDKIIHLITMAIGHFKSDVEQKKIVCVCFAH